MKHNIKQLVHNKKIIGRWTKFCGMQMNELIKIKW